jgi:cysteine-rich repeat protein
MRLRVFPLFGLLALGLAARPAEASFHLMNIVEVFPGSVAAPNAKYVVLQMYTGGQNFVAGHPVHFYDRTGALITTIAFGSDLPNGADQDKILIATAEAQAFFNVTPNLVMTPAAAAVVRLEGGKICFDTIDCVAWGNYAPADATVGTPFQDAVGLAPGVAMRRRLDLVGSPTVLDFGEDTNDCANDFVAGLPAPRNNQRVNGTVPASTCGNSAIESLEECDDGNVLPGDMCSQTCRLTRLFADGFETADLSRWHAAALGSTTDLTVSGAAALQGGFGLQGVVNDTEGLYVQNDSPQDEQRYRVRFRFDPNGFDPGEALVHFRTRLLIGFDEAPQRRLLAVVLRRIGGQYAIMGRARRDDNTQANTGFVNVDNGPHTIELDWQRSTAAGADNGSFRIWIDGLLQGSVAGLDNDAGGIDFVRLGALSVKAGASGTMFWDDLDSRQQTQIDPLGP